MAGHLRFKDDLMQFGLNAEDAMALIALINGPDLSRSRYPFLTHIDHKRVDDRDGKGHIILTLHYPGFSPDGTLLETIRQMAVRLYPEGLCVIPDDPKDDGLIHSVRIYPVAAQETIMMGFMAPYRLKVDADTDDLDAEFKQIISDIRQGFRVPPKARMDLLEALHRHALLELADREDREILEQMQASAMEPPPDPVPARFFCPGCGCRLYRDPRVNTDRDPYSVFCINRNCGLRGDTLTVHHPIHGHQSAPGDSWSLSFIK